MQIRDVTRERDVACYVSTKNFLVNVYETPTVRGLYDGDAYKRRNAETNPPAPNSRGHPLSVKGAQEKRWECGKEETPGAEKEWMGHIISVIYSGGCLSLQ